MENKKYILRHVCPISNFVWYIYTPLVTIMGLYRKRKVTDDELEWYADHLSDIEFEPFEDSGSEYQPSSVEGISESDFENDIQVDSASSVNLAINKGNLLPTDNCFSGETDTLCSSFPVISTDCTNETVENQSPAISIAIPDINFFPRMKVPDVENQGVPMISCNRSSCELDIFLKIFPCSLFIRMAECTNKRLDILRQASKKNKIVPPTDISELMIVTGCLLIMSYNHVPSLHYYWSINKSIGNEAIKSTISRDRCLLLMSKLYFNNPKKPDGVSKTYYVDELASNIHFKYQGRRALFSQLTIQGKKCAQAIFTIETYNRYEVLAAL